jgi:hypothetical protein
MRDRVSIISWVYPETSLFYFSLFSGTIGLFVVFIISLRRPGAADWVKFCWKHCRKVLIVALVFDLFTHVIAYFYWQLFSVEWIIMQTIVSMLLISLCFTSERFKVNLEEFPLEIPVK